jgi:hypothetical protein
MHLGLLFKKLGVTNRTEAAVLGIKFYGRQIAPTRLEPSTNSEGRRGVTREFDPKLRKLG